MIHHFDFAVAAAAVVVADEQNYVIDWEDYCYYYCFDLIAVHLDLYFQQY